MQDNPEGGELDPAEGVRRRCKKNSSVLSCVGRGQEKAVTAAAKSVSSQRMRLERASSSEESEGIWQGRDL